MSCMIYVLLVSDNIRYCFFYNDENHIRYDFMCVAQLSYQLSVSRRADPVSGGHGSPLPPHNATSCKHNM